MEAQEHFVRVDTYHTVRRFCESKYEQYELYLECLTVLESHLASMEPINCTALAMKTKVSCDHITELKKDYPLFAELFDSYGKLVRAIVGQDEASKKNSQCSTCSQ